MTERKPHLRMCRGDRRVTKQVKWRHAGLVLVAWGENSTEVIQMDAGSGQETFCRNQCTEDRKQINNARTGDTEKAEWRTGEEKSPPSGRTKWAAVRP